MSEAVSFSGPPVCVVGNINRDVKLLGVPESPALFHDGETTVPGVVETIGGGGANSACVAAALGASVRFVGKTGCDALAERLRQAARRAAQTAVRSAAKRAVQRAARWAVQPVVRSH